MTSALLVMDIQNGIVDRHGDSDVLLSRLERAVPAAHPEVHRVLTEKVFPRQAKVTTVDTWAAGL